MTSPAYDTGNPWTDGYNLAVLGKTQTGKTSICRELHATSPRVSIWLNEAGDSRVPDVASEGQVVRSVAGVRKAFQRDQYAINFVSRDRESDLVDLKEFLWSVADRVDRELQMQLIVDEVDRLAPQSGKSYGNYPSRDAVRDLTSEGVKRGIKFVAITQDPTKYDKQSLRQSEYRLIYDMSNENRTSSVVSRMGLNWDAVDETADRYTGVLHDDSGSVLDAAVKAEERFA
jgi:hypothetical protein